MQESDSAGYDSDGSLVPTEGFRYDELDGESQSERSIDSETAIALLSTVMRWLWDGANVRCKSDGLRMRALVLCWIFLPELRIKSETQLAHEYGKKHKQSIGRQVAKFKSDFPYLKNPHMREK